MSTQERYAQLFAAEVGDRLSEIGRLLVELEEGSGDSEAVNALFRSVHTIKGMAGAMGYDVVTRLSHQMEAALDELRSGRRRVDPDVIDKLLACNDLLGQAIGARLRGEAAPDPAVFIEQLVLWRLAGDSENGGGVAVSPAGPERTVTDDTAREREERPEAGAPSAPLGIKGDARERSGQRGLELSRVPVDIKRLDELLNLIGELGIVAKRLGSAPELAKSEPLKVTVEAASTLIAELKAQILESRLVPLWQIFDRFPRLVRDGARTTGKEIELHVLGKDLEADRSLLDAINDPLVHLLRNAIDHGIERPEDREAAGKPRVGRIELSARRERSRLVITVGDDGRGVDRRAVVEKAREEGLLDTDRDLDEPELVRILARPGFSTLSGANLLSGRGVGLNVVEERVRGVGGSVELKTESGGGTMIRLELPLTLAVVRALIVEVGDQIYAIPASFARESFVARESWVEMIDGQEWVVWRERRVPLTRLRRLFKMAVPPGAEDEADRGDRRLNLLALEFGGSQRVVSVDAFVGEEEILVKSFDMPAGAVSAFSGATVRPDGRPALVLDVGSLS